MLALAQSLAPGLAVSIGALAGWKHHRKRYKQKRRSRREAIWNRFMEENEDRWGPPPYIISETPQHSAAIVECREHPHLKTVLTNVMHYLDERWGLTIFHGSDNEQMLREITDGWGAVQLINLHKQSLTLDEYDELFTSPWFWNSIPGEMVLIFQTDALLRRQGIDEFLQYDYVGAPWHDRMGTEDGLPIVGNGGLSLRRKSAMLEVLREHPYDGRPEDNYFCFHMMTEKYHMPAPEKAQQFSVETLMYGNPLGMHKPWAWQHENCIRALLQFD